MDTEKGKHKIIKFDIDFDFVTPVFLRGFKDNEFRLSSFKGILRYWWRAIQYSKYENIDEMAESENKIFGSTTTGQSKIIIYQPPPIINQSRNIDIFNLQNRPGLSYLGYGLKEDKRKALDNVKGKIKLVCPEIYKDQIIETLQAISLFGNIGGRSRKGYGSIRLKSISINGNTVFSINSYESLKSEISKFLSKFNQPAIPKISAFSENTFAYCYNPQEIQKPIDLLNFIGEQMQLYRSYGQNGKVNGIDAHQNFKDDHDLIDKFSSNTNKHPRRIVFGLPHNYYFSSSARNISVEPISNDPSIKDLRRASPLFIKIHEFDGKSIFVALILKSEFLSNNINIKIEDKSGLKTPPITPEVDYSVFNDFFEGISDKIYFSGIEKLDPYNNGG
jgi:CRISPR-associated protein Cmr1